MYTDSFEPECELPVSRAHPDLPKLTYANAVDEIITLFTLGLDESQLCRCTSILTAMCMLSACRCQ